MRHPWSCQLGLNMWAALVFPEGARRYAGAGQAATVSHRSADPGLFWVSVSQHGHLNAVVLEELVTRQVCVEGSFSLDCSTTASWDSPCDSEICALHQHGAAVVPPWVEPGQAGGLSGQRGSEEHSGQGDSGQKAGGEEHPEAKEGLPGWREQEKMRSTQDGKEAAPRVCRA